MSILLKAAFKCCFARNPVGMLLKRVPRVMCSSLVKSPAVTDAKEATSASETESDAPEKPIHADNHPGLMQFFDDPRKWGESEIKSGRSWKKDELRIKSNSDLHKLWFVLLKERNMLKTMEENAKSECELFASPERLDKVEESMSSLEQVVRERNQAYWDLEVGEGATGEQPQVYRRDMFGRHRLHGCSEHLIPFWMNNKWRNLYAPGHGKHVEDFILKLKEKQVKKANKNIYYQHYYVRQLLRRFPDMDLEYLQEKYPRVPVNEMKENLVNYKERRYISLGTQKRPFDH